MFAQMLRMTSELAAARDKWLERADQEQAEQLQAFVQSIKGDNAQSNDGKAAPLKEEGAEPSHCSVKDGNHLHPPTSAQMTATTTLGAHGQFSGSKLVVDGATLPSAPNTNPISNAEDCISVGTQPSGPVPSVTQRQIKVEDDIRNEIISINAIISAQFPSGFTELCALHKKSILNLDRYITRIVNMLAYWKQNYADSDSTIFDSGLHTARTAQKWALDLELASELAYGLKSIYRSLPVFTDQLDMPV